MIITKKIKMIILAVVIALFLLMSAGLGVSIWHNHKLKAQYEQVLSNQTGYIRDLAAAKNDIHQYQLTITDLRYMNDSVANKMLELQEKLKLKDKQIKNLQYLSSTFHRTDTVELTDTIFLDQEFCMDTIVGDKWMNTHLKMEWPAQIYIEPSVLSEKTVVIYTTKETVKPPKKCWLARLFQKKHKVVKVYIEESNPYIEDQKNEFIEVVK